MPRVDVITTVDMLAIDTEAHAREKFENPCENVIGCGFISSFCRAFVSFVGFGKDSDVHCDGSIVIVNANKKEYSSEHNKPDDDEGKV